MRSAVADGSLVKLTLGKPKGSDPTLRNLFRPPRRSQVGGQARVCLAPCDPGRDKELRPEEAIGILEPLVGTDFLDAHLFTATGSVQLETGSGHQGFDHGAEQGAAAAGGNDRSKTRSISSDAPWLRALGVTDPIGRPMPPWPTSSGRSKIQRDSLPPSEGGSLADGPPPAGLRHGLRQGAT